jgi:hypothetical protein
MEPSAATLSVTVDLFGSGSKLVRFDANPVRRHSCDHHPRSLVHPDDAVLRDLGRVGE